MKEETKYLIAWIKDVIANCPYIAMPDSIRADSDEKKEDAIKFLDSFPEIESHLCRGGYIQYRNGTSCCDGDKVMLVEDKHIGVLTWVPDKARFYLTFTYRSTNSETVQQIAVDKNEIEKVEE